MDDLIAVWAIGRNTGRRDEHGKQLVALETELVEDMTVDGVLRRLRAHMLEDDVVALSLKLGERSNLEEGDLVADTHPDIGTAGTL